VNPWALGRTLEGAEKAASLFQRLKMAWPLYRSVHAFL